MADKRSAFTMVELLVSIAIISVLVALLLPAIQESREAARRASCTNNLKQIALAVQLHHDAHEIFPAARYEPNPKDPVNQCGGREPSWIARVLPFVEQEAFSDQWELSQKWYLHPEDVRHTMPKLFFCPSRRGPEDGLHIATRYITDEEINLEFGTGEEEEEEAEDVSPRSQGRLPCGCPRPGNPPRPPIPSGPADPDAPAPPPRAPGSPLIIEGVVFASGAVIDYAGNHGDLSPGATGADTDFYYGGNGTGVIISVRPKCKNGEPYAVADRVRMSSVRDGQSTTFLLGEKHVPYNRLTEFPEDSPALDGDHIAASCRIAGPGLRLAHNPRDPLADFLSFGSWHPGITHFAMVDGSVRAMSVETDTRVLGSLANRLDARIVELDSD